MNLIHLVDHADTGHEPSPDCWCEPLTDWYYNGHGNSIGVVHHVDLVPLPHSDVIIHRTRQANWVTKILTESALS